MGSQRRLNVEGARTLIQITAEQGILKEPLRSRPGTSMLVISNKSGRWVKVKGEELKR
jgi:hypothetical protein